MASIPSSARRFRGPIVLVMAGVLVMSLSGAVGAANPAGWTKINACVNKTTKVTKIRTTAYSATRWCRPGERLFTWSIVGPRGPQGLPGTNGTNGTNGLPGAKGDTGDVGPKGDPGDVGSKGDTGDVGPKGDKGDTGDVGPKGDTGDVGPKGDTGDVGPKGDTGDVGPKGDTGDVGPKGDTGDVGPKGDQGDPGPAGGLSGVSTEDGTTSGFAGNDGLGTTVTATATCSTGTLVSGGGEVTGNNAKKYAVLTASYPSDATTWSVTATIVAGTLANGSPPSLTAYALCAS